MDIVLPTISLVTYFMVTLHFVGGVYRSKVSVGGKRLDAEFIRFLENVIVGDSPPEVRAPQPRVGITLPPGVQIPSGT